LKQIPAAAFGAATADNIEGMQTDKFTGSLIYLGANSKATWTFDVQYASTFAVSYTMAGLDDGAFIELGFVNSGNCADLNPTSPGYLSATTGLNTGAYNSYKTTVAANIDLPAGPQVLGIQCARELHDMPGTSLESASIYSSAIQGVGVLL
jgi:hypothetical protein